MIITVIDEQCLALGSGHSQLLASKLNVPACFATMLRSEQLLNTMEENTHGGLSPKFETCQAFNDLFKLYITTH